MFGNETSENFKNIPISYVALVRNDKIMFIFTII